MIRYFENSTEVDKLRRILSEWDGTPYRHRVCVKGKGADCIHFVVGVLDEMGIMKFRKKMVPDYAHDWHLHNTREQLLERVMQYVPKAQELTNRADIQDGDLPMYHYGQASAHIGIYLEGNVWQAISGSGVIKVRYSDRIWKKRLRRVVRIMK